MDTDIFVKVREIEGGPRGDRILIAAVRKADTNLVQSLKWGANLSQGPIGFIITCKAKSMSLIRLRKPGEVYPPSSPIEHTLVHSVWT